MTRTLDDRLSRDVETASTLSTRGESASPCHLRSSEPSLTMQLGVREYAGTERGLRPARATDRSCSDAAAEECLMRDELVAGNSVRRESDDLGIRINELGTKCDSTVAVLVVFNNWSRDAEDRAIRCRSDARSCSDVVVDTRSIPNSSGCVTS